jgi:ABC-2 type transport system permease protein
VKTARLVLGYVRHNLMSAMAYRGAFMLQVVGMILNDAMLLFFWWALFGLLDSLHGWDLAQVMMLYSVVAFGYGAATVVCGNLLRVARIIVTGDLDYYLALPADPLVHLLVSRTSMPGWGDLGFSLIVFVLAAPRPWVALPLFLSVGTLVALVFTAFAVLMGSLAFWIGSAESVAFQGVNAMLTFSLYPVEIFPGVVRLLLYTLIPAAFVGSLPAGLLAHFRWEQLLYLMGFTVGILLLARGMFYRGLRRYESGNLVTVRG